jgi:hypothetical protein
LPLARPARLSQNKIICAYPFPTAGSPVSENSPSIPTLRLGGSAVQDYARLLLRCADPGALRTFFMTRMVDQPMPMPAFGFYLAALILVFTLGIWNAACALIALSLRFKTAAAALAFPFLVIMNYLVMSLGLALDTKKIGTPEELLHRPFVWTYFVVAVWTSGGIYALILGNQAPKTLPGRIILCLLALISIGVPLVFARGIQTMPIWGPSATTNSVPTEIVEATRYIRKHSRSTDTVQDSAGDPKFAITGLTERQCYAHEYPSGEFRSPLGLRQRLVELDAFEQMTTEDELNAFVDTHTMSWYILRPETEVAWPATFQDKTAFRSGEYRVYHFYVP